ncbi:MAG: hypothetical protein KatS3mg071_1806 [Meiothermus sp.]|nr:MAG: hypothetical protein KatS3mg071_1806 [Meiothermus sp.]
MHRAWAARRAWRVRLWLATGLALLLFPLAWLVHPAWVLGSLLGLLYPSRWEERRALADLDRQYGLAYRSALEAPPHHPWRNQLQLEAAASLRGARLPTIPWVFVALYLVLVGLAWVMPPLRPPSSPAVASSPPSPPAPQTTRPTDPAQPSPQPTEPPPPQGNSSEGQQPGVEPGEAINPAEESQPTRTDSPAQEGGAQGQNQPQDAVGQDATRPGQTGENLQGREEPSSSPNGQDPAQSGQNSPNPTGQPQTNQPGQAQPPQPGQAQPPQPGQAQPSQPGQAQPSQPGQAQPTQPGQTQPSQAGRPQSEPNQPSQPGQPSQSQPGQAQPSQPGQAQPGQGQPSRDNPGQGQARGGEGGSPQARPPQNLPLRTERPAGEAPLSRGENRQGRPAPLPSPWASGQPPQNVQRQAEKYLESEPLPPEVRNLVRRYFELPP